MKLSRRRIRPFQHRGERRGTRRGGGGERRSAKPIGFAGKLRGHRAGQEGGERATQARRQALKRTIKPQRQPGGKKTPKPAIARFARGSASTSTRRRAPRARGSARAYGCARLLASRARRSAPELIAPGACTWSRARRARPSGLAFGAARSGPAWRTRLQPRSSLPSSDNLVHKRVS